MSGCRVYVRSTDSRYRKEEEWKDQKAVMQVGTVAPPQEGWLVLYGTGPRLTMSTHLCTVFNSKKEATSTAKKYGLKVIRTAQVTVNQMFREIDKRSDACCQAHKSDNMAGSDICVVS